MSKFSKMFYVLLLFSAAFVITDVALNNLGGNTSQSDGYKLLPDTVEQYKTESAESAEAVATSNMEVKQLFKQRRRRLRPSYNSAPYTPAPTIIPRYIQEWDDVPSDDPDVFGEGSGLWNWSPAAEYHQAAVRIHVVRKEGMKRFWYMGTGVIVNVRDGHYEILTCSHVVNGATKFVVQFADGGVSIEGRILSELEVSTSDAALISVPVPKNSRLKPVVLASEAPKRGETVECLGFGGSSKLLRTFYATAGPMTSRQRTIVLESFAPGDSGGPCFNSDGELVGLMSRAAIDWWDAGLEYRDKEVKLAWPGLFVGLKPINGVMKNHTK